MYLREIGKVYLLTADDEKHLARQMEEGNHIREIEEAYITTFGHPPSAARVAVSLFEQWDGLLNVFKAAKTYIDDFDKVVVKPAPTFGDDGQEIVPRAPKWRDANGKKLDITYKMAWLVGLKTTYYLRAIAATQTEKSTVNDSRLNRVKNTADEAPEMSKAADVPKACSLDNPDCEACQ